MYGTPRPGPSPAGRLRGRLVLDTGPLLDLLAALNGLPCAYDEAGPLLEETLPRILAILRGVDLASVWPVFTEALHLLDSRCRVSKRSDARKLTEAVKRWLAGVREEAVGFHRALQRLAPGVDLADAALLELAASGAGIYTIGTGDSLLAERLRRQGTSALTLWELLSLAGALGP